MLQITQNTTKSQNNNFQLMCLAYPHGVETWTLRQDIMHEIKIIQRAVERTSSAFLSSKEFLIWKFDREHVI